MSVPLHWPPIAVAFLTGCATASQVVPLTATTYAPRPADYPILLYSAALPTCAFEEIAIVRAHKEMGFVSRDAVVDALIAQLALRRRQSTAYHRLSRRELGATEQPRRPHMLPVSIAARTQTAA